MPQIPSPPLPLPPLPPPPSSPPQSLLQLCIEPQEVNSVANTISRITRIHHQPPNNVHLSYSGEHGQDSETVSAHKRHRMHHTQAVGTSVWCGLSEQGQIHCHVPPMVLIPHHILKDPSEIINGPSTIHSRVYTHSSVYMVLKDPSEIINGPSTIHSRVYTHSSVYMVLKDPRGLQLCHSHTHYSAVTRLKYPTD